MPEATVEALRRNDGVPVYVLGPESAIDEQTMKEIERIAPSAKRVGAEGPVENAIEFARYADGDFGWNINDPGHGFVIANTERPLDAAAAAPLSGSGTWGPLLVTDDARRAAGRAARLPARPQARLRDDPTRALYNHIWLIGDTDALSVDLQAEVDELAEVAPITSGSGGARAAVRSPSPSPTTSSQKPMSESERPDRLCGREITVEDIRALAGPSTPHFALQIRNRIARLIAPLPDGHPARVEGERQIARLTELAEHSGDPRGAVMPARRRPRRARADDRAARPRTRRSRAERGLNAAGYLDLLEGELESTGATQDLMVTRLVPAIYERYWRPALGRVFKGVTGPGWPRRSGSPACCSASARATRCSTSPAAPATSPASSRAPSGPAGWWSGSTPRRRCSSAAARSCAAPTPAT